MRLVWKLLQQKPASRIRGGQKQQGSSELALPLLPFAQSKRRKLACGPSLLLTTIFAPFAPSIAAECDPQDAEGRELLTIDARVVSLAKPRREYPLNGEVQVNIVNKNPFRFEYTLATEERAVEESAIDSFLGLPYFGSLSAMVAETSVTPAVPSDRETGVAETDFSSCSDTWKERILRLEATVSKHVADVGIARVSANNLNTQINPLKAKLAQARSNLSRPDASCTDLVGYIQTLQSDFASTPRLRVALTRLKSELNDADLAYSVLQKEITVTTTTLVADSGASDPCRQAIRQSLASAETSADAYRLLYTDLVEKQKSHTSTVTAMETAIKDVTRASSEPGAFTSSTVLGPYATATDVTVTLKRRDTTQQNASDEQVASLTANFGGGPKFSLSVGLGLGGLKTREFRREQSVDQTTGSVVNVVGLAEDSDWRTTPMVFLHGRIADAWSITAGLGPHSDDQGTNVDGFLGLSWHFASRGRISFGAYLGKVQELGGGFELGDVVPEDVAEVPIERSSRMGPGVFFSWEFIN